MQPAGIVNQPNANTVDAIVLTPTHTWCLYIIHSRSTSSRLFLALSVRGIGR